MKCPNCQIDLTKKQIHGIEVDECSKCEGIWFEKDELRQVKDRIDSDLNWMDFEIWEHVSEFDPKPSRYSCPNCEQAMGALEYASTGIDIDCCTSCHGIWIDRDELTKIILALEEELVSKSLGEYVKSTLNEARELIDGPESFLSEWKDFSTVLRFVQYRILSKRHELNAILTSFQKLS